MINCQVYGINEFRSGEMSVEVGWNKFTEEEEFRISHEERGEEKIIAGKVERQE